MLFARRAMSIFGSISNFNDWTAGLISAVMQSSVDLKWLIEKGWPSVLVSVILGHAALACVSRRFNDFGSKSTFEIRAEIFRQYSRTHLFNVRYLAERRPNSQLPLTTRSGTNASALFVVFALNLISLPSYSTRVFECCHRHLNSVLF